MTIALLASNKSDAQIVYTYIEPDSWLDNMGSFSYITEPIDLNNDGNVDLEVISAVGTASSSIFDNVVKISPDNGNRVANSGGFFNCFCSVAANNYGDVIGSDMPGFETGEEVRLPLFWFRSYW